MCVAENVSQSVCLSVCPQGSELPMPPQQPTTSARRHPVQSIAVTNSRGCGGAGGSHYGFGAAMALRDWGRSPIALVTI
jgi:hypothetical protein